VIAIVDYGSGNIKAIFNIYHRLGIPAFVASRAEELERATKVILPGVGAFDQVIRHLEASGIRPALADCVLNRNVPLLGVCVGMQLLAKSSDEGTLSGLGWIDGHVKKFDCSRFTQRTHLPHMGWNDVRVVRPHPLLEDLDGDAIFYFLHSYYFSCNSADNVLAEADYGGPFACAVHTRNIFGVQFHPEKSHQAGIHLLRNFANL
jgi:glutamine amidotransferase